MKIIIPMSGTGDRFVKAGYSNIKPLIEVDGKPIIEHVIGLFPGEEDFIFVCNSEHLQTTSLGRQLKNIKPSGTIVSVDPHKLGPVYAVLQAAALIIDDEPVIVNYCDFSVYWDYADFKKTVTENGCHGCITAYKGFHPHLLNDNLYAGIRSDRQNYLLEIREKHSFTENKMDSFQSAGTYYFSRGSYIKTYFNMLMDKGMSTNNEYYVSTVYQLLKEDALDIYIYEVEHFLQWGTPEDLEAYTYWSEIFKAKRKADLLK